MTNFSKPNTTVRTRELIAALAAKTNDVKVEVQGDHVDGYRLSITNSEMEAGVDCPNRASVNSAIATLVYWHAEVANVPAKADLSDLVDVVYNNEAMDTLVNQINSALAAACSDVTWSFLPAPNGGGYDLLKKHGDFASYRVLENESYEKAMGYLSAIHSDAVDRAMDEVLSDEEHGPSIAAAVEEIGHLEEQVEALTNELQLEKSKTQALETVLATRPSQSALRNQLYAGDMYSEEQGELITAWASMLLQAECMSRGLLGINDIRVLDSGNRPNTVGVLNRHLPQIQYLLLQEGGPVVAAVPRRR